MDWLRAGLKACPFAALGLVMTAARPASAEELRDFCPDRPGLGTPACTIDPGHLAAELGVIDATIDRLPDAHEDTVAMGDLLLRHGVNDSFEVQFGWTSLGHGHEWNTAEGAAGRPSGTGDIRLAIRQNLHNADGAGMSVALMPYVTLPVGDAPLGAGDGGAGLLVPFSYELPFGMKLGVTAQIDAAPDGDGSGNHLAYSGILGLDVPLFDVATATFEFLAAQHRDPSGPGSELLAGLSVGWMATGAFQVDAGANIGLDRDAPDLQIYMGFARRF